MSWWNVRKIIRFSHCDPAGIVYYPRYFDLLHEAKEDWLREAVGVSLPELIAGRRHGLPIASLEADFVAPSRMGDELDVAVIVARVGGASLHLHYEVRCGGERRMVARTVLVHMGLDDGRPLPFDDDLRKRLEQLRRADETKGSEG
jgi:4-hydroxybenzoyl-CoA thioesterase